MNKQIKKPLVPRLRFPEFQDAGEWEETLFDEIAVFYRRRNISKMKRGDSGGEKRHNDNAEDFAVNCSRIELCNSLLERTP